MLSNVVTCYVECLLPNETIFTHTHTNLKATLFQILVFQKYKVLQDLYDYEHDELQYRIITI